MIRNTFPSTVLALTLTLATALSASAGLQKVGDQSAKIFEGFQSTQTPIPAPVLAKAKAVAVTDTTEGGLIFTGKSGSGVIVHRVGNSWSGPVGISTSGASFGLSAGGKATKTIYLLMDNKAIKQFMTDDNVKFEGDISGAAGPTGVTIGNDFVPNHSVYTYSYTDGVFGGMSVEGGVISYEKEQTFKYYGEPVGIKAVLMGEIKPPAGAAVLTSLLDKYPPAQ